MPIRTAGTRVRTLAVVGLLCIAAATVVSVVTDDESWAWGVMMLTSLVGIVLLDAAAVMALAARRGRSRRAPPATG